MQAAPAAGATVIGAAGGPEKSAAVRAVGALHVVDYGDPLWPTTARDELGDRGITVVLDGVGGDIATAAMNVQVPGGRLVMFGWASGVPARLGAFDPMRLGISACVGIGPRVPARPGGLRPLQQAALDAVASGRWVPLIGPAFAPADAAAAQTAMVRRRTVGKTVLHP